MTSTYIACEIRAGNGERFAILLCQDTNAPLYWPNLFASTQLRARSLATNTICRSLSNIGLIYQWASGGKLDLDRQLEHGEPLSFQQLEQLAGYLRYSRADMKAKASLEKTRQQIVSLESVRRSRKSRSLRQTASTREVIRRLRDVVKYLRWHAIRRMGNFSSMEVGRTYLVTFEAALNQLSSLIPSDKPIDVDAAPTGLLPEQRELLLTSIHPDSSLNPFRGSFQRSRNHLLISLLYYVGLRRGESLQLKVEDLDVHNRVVKIHRSADDSDDMRPLQPRTKTLARTVPIPENLADDLHNYVVSVWSRIPLAKRKHGYLWTTKNGTPLSLSAVNNIFRNLRQKVAGIPGDITPHILRHDWNERLSEIIDALPSAEKIDETKERRIRSQLMGWAPDSDSARVYTRRSIRKKAGEIAEAIASSYKKTTNGRPIPPKK